MSTVIECDFAQICNNGDGCWTNSNMNDEVATEEGAEKYKDENYRHKNCYKSLKKLLDK